MRDDGSLNITLREALLISSTMGTILIRSSFGFSEFNLGVSWVVSMMLVESDEINVAFMVENSARLAS